jgi:acetyltransferase-like isoleucine patch superfamily enzyme
MSFFTAEEKLLYSRMGYFRRIKFLLGTSRRRTSAYLIRHIPFLRPVYQTRNHENPITIRIWFFQKILGINRYAYWPVHFTSEIKFPKNIYVGVDTAPGLSPGCYIQAVGKVYIDDYTEVSPNVGIISSNHDLIDLRKHRPGEVRIGKYCWIGMNSVILPNVTLGDFTTVMAGSVVNKSFPEGYCVIGGNPATLIKQFPPETHYLFVRHTHEHPYNGYIPSAKFEAFRKKHLYV